MENIFESARNYIEQLDKIDTNWHLDKGTIAGALMSYSAKTNKPNRKMLENFAIKFREWQRQWDLFDKKESPTKPKSLSEFIDSLILDGIQF